MAGGAVVRPRRRAAGPAADPRAELVRRYLALVEARHAERPAVADLARALGVSPAHLGRACRAAAGRSAQALLHARTVLEAKRRLAWTAMGVAEIGWSLGFSDPAYFSRFFARETGLSPTAFRERSGG